MRNTTRGGLVALLGVGLCLAGCKKETTTSGDSGATGDAGGKKIRVCLLPKKKGLPYFSSCADGAREAAKELANVELIYDGPTDGSPEKAASMIEKWTLKGVDVIAVSPNDPDVLAPAMKKARDKGVHVIFFRVTVNDQIQLVFPHDLPPFHGIAYGHATSGKKRAEPVLAHYPPLQCPGI